MIVNKQHKTSIPPPTPPPTPAMSRTLALLLAGVPVVVARKGGGWKNDGVEVTGVGDEIGEETKVVETKVVVGSTELGNAAAKV